MHADRSGIPPAVLQQVLRTMYQAVKERYGEYAAMLVLMHESGSIATEALLDMLTQVTFLRERHDQVNSIVSAAKAGAMDDEAAMLQAIGEMFGGFDHPAVGHYRRALEELQALHDCVCQEARPFTPSMGFIGGFFGGPGMGPSGPEDDTLPGFESDGPEFR